MKKIALTIVLMFAFAGAHAQVGSGFGVNMFMSVDGGVSMYSNSYNDNPMGFSGGISVGKWILSPLALRVTFDFKSVPFVEDGKKYTSNFVIL